MSRNRRSYRVAERVREILAQELLHSDDERFYLVTITSVAVTPDLREARVYWVNSGDSERTAEVEVAFEEACGALRRVVAKELGARFVPELQFFYDDTLDTVAEVDRLFEKIREK